MKRSILHSALLLLALTTAGNAVAGNDVPAAINETTTQTSNTQTMNTNDKILTARQRALVAVAAREALGCGAKTTEAVNAALDAGLTINEVREAFSHLYAYTGFPRSLNALGALQSVAAERKAAGKQDSVGRDASPLPADYNALREGTAVQTQLTGQPYNYEFAPATDFYLKAHLFGDIFARDVLTHAERELVTVSALAALEGVAPQLQAHVRGAKNMGLTDEEIHAIPAALAEAGDEMAAHRATVAIAAVYGETCDEAAPLVDPTFPKGEPNTAYAQYFIGNSFLAPVAGGPVPIANVTFEPRCRNNWHIHHKGVQVLICVSGRGWYVEEGKEPRELHPGDIVEIPAEAKHWHGAARDSWFQHLAFMKADEGASNEWLEPVTDEEYNKLP